MWTRARHPQSDRSDKLKLTSTGSGGLAELREQLDDSKASYAYARVQYSNDKESVREKFILIVRIGPNCKVMRKAKVRSFARSHRTHLHLVRVVVIGAHAIAGDADLGARGGCKVRLARVLDRSARSREGRSQGGADHHQATEGASSTTCDSSHAHGLRRLGVQATMAFNRTPSFTLSSPCTILSSLPSVIFV